MFFWDYTIFLIIPPLLLALYAQSKVKSTFSRFSKSASRSQVSASEVARRILNSSGAGNVTIERTSGRLSDHYDPRKRVLRLSEGVYSSSSLPSSIIMDISRCNYVILSIRQQVSVQLWHFHCFSSASFSAPAAALRS